MFRRFCIGKIPVISHQTVSKTEAEGLDAAEQPAELCASCTWEITGAMLTYGTGGADWGQAELPTAPV